MELIIRFTDDAVPDHYWDPQKTWVEDGFFCVAEGGWSTMKYPINRLRCIEQRFGQGEEKKADDNEPEDIPISDPVDTTSGAPVAYGGGILADPLAGP